VRITPAGTLAAVVTIAATGALAGAAAAQVAPPTPPVTITYSYERDAPPVTFTSIRLKSVPDGSTVVVRCLTASGERCKRPLRRAFRAEDVSGTVEVDRFTGRRIRPGRRLVARISSPGNRTVFKTIRVRRSGAPTITTECSDPGSTERGPC
jgi:hypothetical protein